eukprot:TRINITY_DN578_c0_g1_i1.p1 TRINITY_DN578_c0_g1~~TRINITY_DN578_c0_g1_i1.p1  ORF type:complete len:456 (+),score=82.25 TRINITY_DN578_c0_g1_i1:72-1370(+)
MSDQSRNRSKSRIFTSDSDYLVGEKIIIFMTGLPARGKSYIARFLKRYLSWSGYNVKVFNVGNHRREKLGTQQTHKFFDHDDKQNKDIRDQLAMSVLETVIYWLNHEGGHVGIHDATNSTVERRQKLLARIQKEKSIQTLFIESVCTDTAMLEANINLKLESPDYRHLDPKQARSDFEARLRNYEKVYQPLDESEHLPYIKLINVGHQVMTNDIHGYLVSQIVFCLMNYHVYPRRIWLTRHGESQDNVQELLGGDSHLSPLGKIFSEALSDYMFAQKIPELKIYTSTLVRTIETAKPLRTKYKTRQTRILNEIYAGCFEGMTYEQIKKKMPEEFEARQKDKLRYRYPNGGESYLDLVERLKPIIIEIERQRSDVMIISHQAVLRTLSAYFEQVDKELLPFLSIPLHTIICITPTPFGKLEKRIALNLSLIHI